MSNRPTDDRFREVYSQLEARIERRYGIAVSVSDVTDPFTGDLDGAEIKIDYDNDAEGAVFLLIHLFGHTVQWNVRPADRELGTRAQVNPSEETLAELEDYEREACEYSLTLLHDCGVHDLDAWLADYAHCDFAYLRHFYKTGEKLPFRDFWRDGTPVLAPREVPAFTPERWKARWDGVVV